MEFFATAPFSMEKPVRNELEKSGVTVTGVSEGKVFFTCNVHDLAITLVSLRCADRVYRHLSTFTATTFDELFDGVARIKWKNIVSQKGKVNVTATCARSQLMSVPDVQSITKKAIMRAFGEGKKNECGEEYPIDVHINRDSVCVALDCCGTGLHKRGYRVKNAPAPLRETMAAGLIALSGYRRARTFCDPFCGSGTLPIEAAMYALNIAPGENREFVCEKFMGFGSFDFARSFAHSKHVDCQTRIFASDISPEQAELTRFHARRAGVEDYINISVSHAKDVHGLGENAIIISNPPYGMRLENDASMREVCSEIGELIRNNQGGDKYFLNAFSGFETYVGMRAKSARRLYNGNIECNLYKF